MAITMGLTTKEKIIQKYNEDKPQLVCVLFDLYSRTKISPGRIGIAINYVDNEMKPINKIIAMKKFNKSHEDSYIQSILNEELYFLNESDIYYVVDGEALSTTEYKGNYCF